MNAISKRLQTVLNELVRGKYVKNKTELAKVLMTQLNVVNDFLNGKRPFTELYADRLTEKFPFVDGKFILTGKGSWRKPGVKSQMKLNGHVAGPESIEILKLKLSHLEARVKDLTEINQLLREKTGK